MSYHNRGFTLIELLIVISIISIVSFSLQSLWISVERSTQVLHRDQLARNIMRQISKRIAVDYRNSSSHSLNEEFSSLSLNDVIDSQGGDISAVRYYIKDEKLWRKETTSGDRIDKEHPITPQGLLAQFEMLSEDLLKVTIIWDNPTDRTKVAESTSFVVAGRREQL